MQIYIPSAVYREIEAGKAKIYYKDLSGIDWINIIEIQDKQAVKYFLDIGTAKAFENIQDIATKKTILLVSKPLLIVQMS